MYLQELLEVAIGLIFVWLVFSIATMQFQEWIVTNWLKWRSRDLASAIGNMLADPAKVTAFYEHPLIQSLFEKPDKKPSYIPAANFSAALFDIIANAGTEKSPIQNTLRKLRGQVEALKEGNADAIKMALDTISRLGQLAADTKIASTAKTEINNSLQNQITSLNNLVKRNPELKALTAELKKLVTEHQDDFGNLFESDQLLDQVRNGAAALITSNLEKDQKLGKAVKSLLSGVEEYATSADKALAIGRANVEGWFDGVMDRLSGWYKRKSQYVALIIGLILAIILNVDSITLAKHLWREPAVRQALAANAEQFLMENPDIKKTTEGEVEPREAIKAFQEQFDGLILPIGWDIRSWQPLKDENNEIRKTKDGAVLCASSDVPGPIRIWNKQCTQITNLPTNFSDRGLKVLGLLLTALAAMQGAPFWFDILKKLVNVRSTGINPDEKPKETEKPAT